MSKGAIQAPPPHLSAGYSPAALCHSGHNHLPLVFRIVITHVFYGSAARSAEEQPFRSPAIPSAGCTPRGGGQGCEKIESFYLPSYSPELNPDEFLNANLKHSVTTAAPARTAKALTRTAVGSLRSIQKQPTRIQNYFQNKDVCYAA